MRGIFRFWMSYGNIFVGLVQLIVVVVVVYGAYEISKFMKRNQPERTQVAVEAVVPLIRTHLVETADQFIPIEKNGTLEAAVYASLTPNVSGTVESVADGLGNGSTFGAGQKLFRIGRDDLEIEVRRRQADLASAQAALEIEVAQGDNARREWDSFGRGEISDLAARGPQIRQAEAQVLTAEANLDAAELDLTRTDFSLPFAGRLIDLSLAVGQRVTEGQSYGRAYSYGDVEVKVGLSNEELALLTTAIGTSAQVEVSVQGRREILAGQVVRLVGEVSRTTRLSELVVSLPARDVERLQLQPGALARVILQGRDVPDAALIPNAALQSGDYVWRVEQGQLSRSGPIVPILRTPQGTLVSGLPHGTRIALGTIIGADEGMAVTYVDAPASPDAGQAKP